MIALHPRLLCAYPWLRGIAFVAGPGVVFVGPTGETLVVRADGGAEEVNALPARRSIASDPTAVRGSP